MMFTHTLIIALISILLYSCAYYPRETESTDQKQITEKKLRHGFKAFSVHDTDNNGSLDKKEYELLLEHREDKRELRGRSKRRFLPPLSFEEIDLNEDNSISEDEMINALNQKLKRHRRNRHKHIREIY